MSAGWRAHGRGDGPRALQLCDQALAAEQRLGTVPNAHLAMESSSLRANIAMDAGAFEEAAAQYLQAARHARTGDVPALAAIYLGLAQGTLSWVAPAVARERGTEGLELARQTGMPHAIATNLLFLAQTMADDDPDRARALLDEAVALVTTLGYENPTELTTTVFIAARLGAWPLALRAASRALDHQLRSGGVGLSNLAGVLNLAARGLAEHRPEPAAAIQGAVRGVLHHLVPVAVAPNSTAEPADVPPQPGNFGTFVTAIRRETTQMLIAALGDARLRELRAQGAAMDETQACTYARTHIDEYLANNTLPEGR
jgi:hypothetical protein